MKMLKQYLGFEGEISRKQFLYLYALPLFFCFIIISFAKQMVHTYGNQNQIDLLSTSLLICAIIYIWTTAAMQVKRLRNAGLSIGWILLNLIALFGQGAVLFICLTYPERKKFLIEGKSDA